MQILAPSFPAHPGKDGAVASSIAKRLHYEEDCPGGVGRTLMGTRDDRARCLGSADQRQTSQDLLVAAHYEEFRRIARQILARDAAIGVIQPTELAHEAAIRMMALDRIAWRDQTHFLATAARIMRQTLIDEVRRWRAAKRQAPVMTRWDAEDCEPAVDIEQFDDLLTRLGEIAPDRARIVELRFYAGLTIAEIGQTIGLSESTVLRRWRAARAWLLGAMDGAPGA